MALAAIIINTVVTLSAWLALSSTFAAVLQSEASLEKKKKHRLDVFSYLWKSSDLREGLDVVKIEA